MHRSRISKFYRGTIASILMGCISPIRKRQCSVVDCLKLQKVVNTAWLYTDFSRPSIFMVRSIRKCGSFVKDACRPGQMQELESSDVKTENSFFSTAEQITSFKTLLWELQHILCHLFILFLQYGIFFYTPSDYTKILQHSGALNLSCLLLYYHHYVNTVYSVTYERTRNLNESSCTRH